MLYVTALQEGFLYGLLAIGVFISLRVLNIPDLTTEGSFGFGNAVAAAAVAMGYHPNISLLFGRLCCWPCHRIFTNEVEGASGACWYYHDERVILHQFDGPERS